MPSFDIVSKLPSAEVDNAVVQAQKEIATRFDFKNTAAEIVRAENVITVRANSDDRLNAAIEVLHAKMVKRGVSLTHLDESKEPEPTAKGGKKKDITLTDGIAQDKAKEIVKALKESKIKVQASIQGDTLRVSGKNRDDLQTAIAFVKGQKLPIALQFTNYRD
ncbi:MAG: YajQ family cyclic di-GMP-binding protein [Deltaproteobacteria bacterium]|nr:YajQ family cyclic di-GMP-binding protein [Deltaproteobacteria bacterium]